MATTQWGTVVQALATKTVAGTTGYRLKGDTTAAKTITVYKGPQAFNTSDLGDWLAIGYGGDGEDAGSWSQETGPLAATAGRPRAEAGIIRCVASAQTGNLEPLDALTRCEAIVAAVEVTLRADPTLGLVPPLKQLVAEMAGAASMSWSTPARGPRCEITFTVTYKARI